MIKRFSIVAVIIVLLCAMTGCSNTTSNSTTTTTTRTSTGTISETVEEKQLPVGEGPLFHNDGWPANNKNTEGIPVPNFTVSPVSVTDGSQFEIIYENVPQNEVVDWVNAVKQAGFSEYAVEKKSPTEYTYRASRSNNLMYIHIIYMSDGTLTITNS